MLLPDGRTIELLKDLDGLRKNEDWALLGRRLGMHPNHVIKIKEILPLPNATIDKESRGTEDYASQYNPMPFSFSVVVKVTDNSILPELQKVGQIRLLFLIVTILLTQHWPATSLFNHLFYSFFIDLCLFYQSFPIFFTFFRYYL
jgi:hypothetical protein